MMKNKSVVQKIGQIILGILILGGFFLLSQLPSLFLGLMTPLFESTSKMLPIFATLIWLLALAGIIKWTFSYYKKKSGDQDQSLTRADVWRAFLFFLLGRVIVIAGTSLMSLLYQDSTSDNDAAIFEMFHPDSPFLYVLLLTLSIAVVAPILEELIFRGLPTALFFKGVSYWIPLVITSLAFSSVHLSSNPISFGMYAVLGGIMYYSYHYKGRIIDSMLVHFFNNIFGAIALFLSYLLGTSFF